MKNRTTLFILIIASLSVLSCTTKEEKYVRTIMDERLANRGTSMEEIEETNPKAAKMLKKWIKELAQGLKKTNALKTMQAQMTITPASKK